MFREESVDRSKYMDWMDKYQAQIVILSAQISWSESVEKALQLTADRKAKGTTALESKFTALFSLFPSSRARGTKVVSFNKCAILAFFPCMFGLFSITSRDYSVFSLFVNFFAIMLE